MSVASRAIFSNFLEEQSARNHPQYLSRLSRALFPTTLLEIAVYKWGGGGEGGHCAKRFRDRAETVENGTTKRCVIEAKHVLPQAAQT